MQLIPNLFNNICLFILDALLKGKISNLGCTFCKFTRTSHNNLRHSYNLKEIIS